MSCKFSANRISLTRQIVLVHTDATSAVDPGFGLIQGPSTLRLRGAGRDDILVGTGKLADFWTRDAILARLPADLLPATYQLELSISAVTAPPGCSSTASLTVSEDIQPALVFTVVVPSVALLGTQVTLVNTVPGFTFQEQQHKPIYLINARNERRELAVDSPWGRSSIMIRLPQPAEYPGYRATEPVHTIQFQTSPHRVPITILPSSLLPRGRFRVLINGFKAVHETGDHALEVDGKRDEIMLRAEILESEHTGFVPGSLGPPPTPPQITLSSRARSVRSKVFGDINARPARIQAGSASDKGGIKTGDEVGKRGRGGDAPTDDRLPLRLWEDSLEAGKNSVVIAPMVWEIDDTIDETLIEPNWPSALNGTFARQLIALVANTIRNRLNLPGLPDLLTAALGIDQKLVELNELLKTEVHAGLVIERVTPGGLGRSGDRPLGLQEVPGGKQQTFPQLLILTYETALLASQTPAGVAGFTGPGQFTINYKDSGTGGEYELWLQIEKVG